MIDTAYV